MHNNILCTKCKYDFFTSSVTIMRCFVSARTHEIKDIHAQTFYLCYASVNDLLN